MKLTKKIISTLGILVIMLGLIPLPFINSVSTVYAQEITSPSEEPVVVEEDTSADLPQPIEPVVIEESVIAKEAVVAEETPVVEDVVVDEAIVEEAAAEDAVLPTEDVVTEPAAAESEVDLTEVVAVLNENDFQVVDENGEALSMTSLEVEDILINSDPFFWNGANWEGYTISGTGCPANVICNASPTPFQEAVTQAGLAGAGKVIYVASGNYNEDVVVDYAGLSFTAFQSITVPTTNTLSDFTSGYAVVDKITLNADFATTLGVYANEVIVNGAGADDGWLDDGMALVNDGGTIEADIDIYGADGHYRARDAYHDSVNFEWECAEPDKNIYPGSSPYRMILKDPYDADILDYYTTRVDERGVSPYNLTLSAAERIEDLLIGVNLANEPGPDGLWTHNDEERIFWYLIGDTGKSRSVSQQSKADAITDGTYDNFSKFWNIWFLWPKTENTNGSSTAVSPANRQLTFLVYDPRNTPTYGCMDPLALNYDPNADTQSEGNSCEYPKDQPPVDPVTPTTVVATPVDQLIIPVTGGENFLIPVTGADLSLQTLVPFGGTLLLGISFLVKGIFSKIKK